MAWFLGILGLIFGATIGGAWGAIILCIAGIWIGKWINRNDEERIREHAAAFPPSPAPTKADDGQPLDDFDSLREEVLSLRRRVEQLEVRFKAERVQEDARTVPVIVRAAAVPVPEIKSAPMTPPATPPVTPAAPVTPSVSAPAPAVTPTPVPPPAPTPQPGATPKVEPAPTPAWGAAPKAEPWTEPKPNAAPVPPPRKAELPKPPAPKEPSLIARLFSGNIVAKVGVVVLFFGVGFLL
jgi:hypothetical protein